MKKFVLPIILVTGIALLIFFNFKSEKKNEIRFRKERSFNLAYTKSNCFPIDFSPAFARIKNGHIILLNFSNQRLYKMNFEGKIIDSLGGGRGDGPLENNHIYAFDIGTKQYFTFDVIKQSINNVGFGGKLKEYYTDSLRIENVVHISNSKFLASYENPDQSLGFKLLDINSKKKENLPKAGKFFPKVPHAYWVYEGRFFKNNSNDFIYLTYYSNDILKFNRNGALEYHKKLIHKTPLIKIKEQGELIIPSENSTPSALDAALDKDFIYVLSNISDKSKSKNRQKRVMDIYRLKDGKYYTSAVLPNEDDSSPMEIAIEDNKLILIYQTKICVYKMAFN